ncbi:MAG: hypothetical protein Fur0018_02220 [Anaerolineales bacterium]
MNEETVFIPTEIDLTAFISQEAHDLKSPFNRILGFTKMVLKGMDGPLTDLQREDLTTVYENSQQALAFIGNLVDMARLSRGEKNPEIQPCTLQHVFSRALETWRSTFPEGRIALENNLPPEDCTLQADANLLAQAYQHMLFYVATWIRKPGRMSVQAACAEGRLRLRITGYGEKDIAAPQMELTMWSFVAGRILTLHGGALHGTIEAGKSITLEANLPTA